MRPTVLKRAFALAGVALIVFTTGVFAADDAVLDPDGATPFTEDSSSPSFDLGDVCLSTDVSHDVLVKAKNGSGSSWADSAVLTLTANGGATGTNQADVIVGVGSPATITLPAGWNASGAGTLSADTAIGTYTVSSSALGLHTANVDWTLTGAQTSGSLSRSTPPVHVDWNVIDCSANAIPIVDAGGTYSSDEGSPIPLDSGSASDTDGSIASVAWSIESASVGTGSCSLSNASSLSLATINCSDNGTAIVKLTATDNEGATAFDTANVIIDNANPSGTFNTPASNVNEGSTFNLSISGPSDASSVDIAAGFMYAFDCGDGYGAFSSVASTSCSTAIDGPDSLAVGGKVQDKDGGESEYLGSVGVANVAPSAPGAPAIAVGLNPNNTGVFSLGWTASTDVAGAADTITYTLRHKDFDDAAFSDVAAGLTTNSYDFTSSPEAEGTWTYQVIAHDEDGGVSDASSASAAIKVDKSVPESPTLTADRAPDYAGGGGWYKDTVTVTSTDNGDPALIDTSAGSGVDPASVASGATFSTSGSHTATDTVLDYATNESAEGSLTVQVDADAPLVSFTSCPSYVVVGSSTSAAWAASDGESGLTGAASGSVALDTSAPSIGNPVPRTASITVYDNVGHSATANCTYGTIQAIFHAPIDGPSVVNVAKAGRVIPVKVDIFVNGVKDTTGPISILVNKLSTCTSNTTDSLETYATAGSANVGNAFRWDSSGGFWIYNLDTSAQGMSAPNCYRGNVYVGGSADLNGKYTGGNLAGYFLIKLAK